MSCNDNALMSPEQVDIPRLRARYASERARRLRSDGEAQYVEVDGSGPIDDHVVDPHKPVAMRAPLEEELDVAILGAGWSGIMAAYHLTHADVTNFRVLDAAGDFGGVWYWNRYPGVQCDNEAYVYLPLLEETGVMPSRKFVDGHEIQAYARHIAERFGFANRGLFHTHVTGLTWDDAAGRWRVVTNRGDTLLARFVIVASGVLNMPKLPSVPGLDRFRGKVFHSARWDYVYTGGSPTEPTLDGLADKSVAIIGTGATAIQIVPLLGRWARHLYVVQRTPSSVDTKPNPVTDPEWVSSLRPGWQAERLANFHRGAMELFRPGEPDLVCDIWTEIARIFAAQMEAEGWPRLSMEELAARREEIDYQVMDRLRRRVDDIVTDPVVAEALKPWYRFMCKRPLASDEYYPTFNRPNVELIDVSDSRGVERITSNGFVANGHEYEVDCIIFASGFEVTSDLRRRWGVPVIEGRDGVSIYRHWADGPRTFQGVMTKGFPNQFYMGYIQGAANASITEQNGRQAEHIAYIVERALRRDTPVVEPEAAAQDAYVAHFEGAEIDTTAFARECTPSYFNNEGEEKPKWRLFRPYAPGWDAFQAMLAGWRRADDLSGLSLRRADDPA